MRILFFVRDLFFTILLAISITVGAYASYRYFVPFVPRSPFTSGGNIRFVLGPPIYPPSDSGATIDPLQSFSESSQLIRSHHE